MTLSRATSTLKEARLRLMLTLRERAVPCLVGLPPDSFMTARHDKEDWKPTREAWIQWFGAKYPDESKSFLRLSHTAFHKAKRKIMKAAGTFVQRKYERHNA